MPFLSILLVRPTTAVWGVDLPHILAEKMLFLARGDVCKHPNRSSCKHSVGGQTNLQTDDGQKQGGVH